jgi:hypothetical protein
METLVAGGGSSTMAQFYKAVEAAMAPYRLSAIGKAALRCYVNRNCVKEGLITATTVARQMATWHITPKGQALVVPPTLVVVPTPPPYVDPPRPAQLRDPLLKVLGKATKFTAGVFVEFTSILDDVVREAGFDPDLLPAGWDRAARSNGGQGAGIDRNITYAFRNAYRNCTPALTMRGPKMGLWGLTSHGVQFIQGLLPRPVPQPRTLHQPILKVMGVLSGHTAGKALGQYLVLNALLVEIGVDPNHQPEGWGDKCPNGQGKMFEALRAAVTAMRKRTDPLLDQPARSQWSLTEEGEAQARTLNRMPPSVAVVPQEAPKAKPVRTGPNLTSKWLSKHLTPPRGHHESQLYAMMRSALTKRLPVSANASMIEDHIQNFMLRAIRRDAFAKVLADGCDLPYSKVVAYSVNSGRTDARDMGTEPVCRELYGARTAKERREMTTEERTGPVPSATVVYDTDENFVPPENTTTIDDGTDFDRLWNQIENAVEDKKPQAWERYAGILAMKAKGFTTQEIADAEGVGRNRAASMLAEARRCVRESLLPQALDAC